MAVGAQWVEVSAVTAERFNNGVPPAQAAGGPQPSACIPRNKAHGFKCFEVRQQLLARIKIYM
jgi:hypothetical protein